MKISTFFILAWLTTLHSVAARRDRSLNRRLKGGKGGKGKGGSKNDDDDGGGDSTTPATGDTSTPQQDLNPREDGNGQGGDNSGGNSGGNGGNGGSSSMSDRACVDSGTVSWSRGVANILATAPGGENIVESLMVYRQDGNTVGSTTASIAEASDASVTGAPIQDNTSGDTGFPFGALKPLATMGERSVCEGYMGKKIVGVPDGLGAYLPDDDTLRLVFQSESYGPLRYESWAYPINDGAAFMGGSHVQYIDYDREMMTGFMESSEPASSMVVGVGNLIDYVYNLKGEMVGARNTSGATTVGAHFGNCDADGNYTVASVPTVSDWFYQSFCSAHLEPKYQWGPGIGSEDFIFMTNEEWMTYKDGEMFVGLGGHAVDIAAKTAWAVGVFTQGGFEKIVELNPQSTDYVIWAMSGYNGDFEGFSAVLDARNEEYGPRSDGKNYSWTNDILPARIYVGVKGLMEDGSAASEDDFLARNGLRYGQLYGFVVDMTASGPTGGLWRDDFHRDADKAKNGAEVPGKWVAQPWRWDGTVKNFQHDGSWDYQDLPPGAEAGGDLEGYFWWNSNTTDVKGCKCEHLTPDPRPGNTAFIQGSTCGYFGHYYVHDVESALSGLDAASGELPDMFDGTYYVYQGELDVTSQIQLGGKGQYIDGADATMNYDDPASPRVTFEDIDGLEVIMASDGNIYAIIQEDSGNQYGERMFLTSPLTHDGNELTYYLVAISGGKLNSRIGVGIPRGTACDPDSHEFSGVYDLSGYLLKNSDGSWATSSSDLGYVKRANDAKVALEDKRIAMSLQAHQLHCGLIEAFQADRGGQLYMYKPDLSNAE